MCRNLYDDRPSVKHYGRTYRSFGVRVPYWLWRLTPSRFKSMELFNA